MEALDVGANPVRREGILDLAGDIAIDKTESIENQDEQNESNRSHAEYQSGEDRMAAFKI
jgi:hypothetical protein